MQDKSRGPVRGHPLYYAWYEACASQTIAPKWRSDFWGFVDAIGDKPEGLVLCRVDNTKPLDVDNFIWKDNARRLTMPNLLDVPGKNHKAGKEKHPLYHIHYHHRRQLQLCEEWAKDFWKFVDDVGEKKEGYSFAKIDESKLLSKDNFFWKEQILINSTDFKEKAAAYARVWRKKNAGLSKSSDLKKRFGINLVQYADKYREQEGVCAICCTPEVEIDSRSEKPRALAVDHNHTTGQIRGLLCRGCNQGIGNFKEDLQRLKNAVAYLESYESSQDVPSNKS